MHVDFKNYIGKIKKKIDGVTQNKIRKYYIPYDIQIDESRDNGAQFKAMHKPTNIKIYV